MVVIKDKLLYKGLKIKYKLHMDKNDLLGTDTYELFIVYQIGFFGDVEVISLSKAWSARKDTVENFMNKWANKSKEELNDIAIEAIKKEINDQIKKEEKYESFKSNFGK